MANKKMHDLFNKKVIKGLQKYNPETNPKWLHYKWRLQTKYGILWVGVFEPDVSEVFSIYAKFEDPELANKTLPDFLKGNFNAYSGKWNFHFYDAQECLNEFFNSLDAI